jgi:hypothetical protein
MLGVALAYGRCLQVKAQEPITNYVNRASQEVFINITGSSRI